MVGRNGFYIQVHALGNNTLLLTVTILIRKRASGLNHNENASLLIMMF